MKPDNKLPKLTRKQAAFVREIIDNPKQSATQAAAKVYNIGKLGGSTNHLNSSAHAIATENLRKPAIVSHLSSASELVEETLTDTVRDWGRADNTRKREIAQTAAMYIHDKVHGKAKQTIEQATTELVIRIDLSQKDDVIEGELT